MKLFVVCPTDGTKIYLGLAVRHRQDLPPLIDVACPGICRSRWNFPRQAVFAEPSQSAIGGAIVGGLLGAIVGPEGAIAGALLGGLLGGAAQNSDRLAAEAFNQEVA